MTLTTSRATKLQYLKIGPDAGTTKFVPVKNFNVDPVEVTMLEDEASYGVADTRPSRAAGRFANLSFGVDVNGYDPGGTDVMEKGHDRLHDLLLASGFSFTGDKTTTKTAMYYMKSDCNLVKAATIEWWLNGAYQKFKGCGFNATLSAKANDILKLDFTGKGQFVEDPLEMAQTEKFEPKLLLGGTVLRSTGRVQFQIGSASTPHLAKYYRMVMPEFTVDFGNTGLVLPEDLNEKWSFAPVEIVAPRTVTINMTVKEPKVTTTRGLPGTTGYGTGDGSQYTKAFDAPNFWTILQQFTDAADYRQHADGEYIIMTSEFGTQKNNILRIACKIGLNGKPTRTDIGGASYYQLSCRALIDTVTDDGKDDFLRLTFAEAVDATIIK